MPRDALDPGRATWRVVAAMGIVHDGASFLDGRGPIYDLAFVGNESPARPRGAGNAWQDRNQADILSGRYPSDHAVATVDFDLLARGENVIAEAREPGTHTFLYRSDLELGGGIQPWPRTAQPRALDEVRDARSALGAVEDPRGDLPALWRVDPGAAADSRRR